VFVRPKPSADDPDPDYIASTHTGGSVTEDPDGTIHHTDSN
jgi:hypothetical protein